MTIKYSLVIPCYNESPNLDLLVDKCDRLVKKNKSIEVILVDNGSTDNTASKLKEILRHTDNIRSIRLDVNNGYGFGILSGLRVANGSILGWTHADMQTDPIDFYKGLKSLKDEKKPDFFIKGKRFGRPYSDTIFTIMMSIFETLLLSRSMWDINAQPTIFSRQFFQNWKNPPNDFSLDLYAYYQAKRNKLKIIRFPVKFGERAFGISHWNFSLKSKWNFVKRTIIYSINLKKNI